MMELYSIICVPVFIDWEEIFWTSNESKREPEFHKSNVKQNEQSDSDDQHIQRGNDQNDDTTMIYLMTL